MPETQVRDIAIDRIREPDFNSRVTFDKDKIEALAVSIKSEGQKQPVEVEESADGSFQLVFGSRRLAAVKVAGLPTIKAIVKPETSRVARILSNGIENLQREDLSTYEKARYLNQLREEKLSGKEMEAATGWSKSYISNLINCFNRLAPEVLADWQANKDAESDEGDETQAAAMPVSYLIVLAKSPKEEQPAIWKAHKESYNAAVESLYDDEDDEDGEGDEGDDGERKPKSFTVKVERYNQILRALKASKSPVIALNVAQFLVGKIDRIKGLIEPPKEEKPMGTKDKKSTKDKE